MLGHHEEWDTNSRFFVLRGWGTNSVMSGVCVSLFSFTLKCDVFLSIAVDILSFESVHNIYTMVQEFKNRWQRLQ